MTVSQFQGQYRFLSNFDGNVINGKTVEHHYQAAKTDSPEWQERILNANTPGMAKKLGRQAPLIPTWERDKLTIMRMLVKIKFSQEPYKSKLLATGDQTLIEGNTWGDTFWGVCDGRGENWLGKILMETREELRNGQ